ncbi:phosphatase [Desulfitobacterium metallireducens]|uniref:Hydrolase n=1 Tax=Desulfitobacterium metallireducens DSM 15288 TaxID=871968 RepID=W0ECV8_9FIRM|nr:phosphatase [Desulfitobacterium metallireducens]AHF06911.1 hydrolase [Desulfitobacterium metallireducens DSM 15288]
MEILADLHTHTIASGHAYSTLSENVSAAARRGIKLLGMTDHGPSMPGAPDLYYYGNFSIIPQMLSGVRILPGVEANITSHEGELDIPLRYLKQMSIVLVGLHVICYPGGNSEQNTEAYLKAMSNPFIDVMVHPGRPEFAMDLEKIAYTSAQLGVPVEINNSSLSSEKGGAWSNCHYFARNAAKYGCPIVLGSDAHFWDRVGGLDLALELAAEAGIREEQILNYSPSRILSYLEQRRRHRC